MYNLPANESRQPIPRPQPLLSGPPGRGKQEDNIDHAQANTPHLLRLYPVMILAVFVIHILYLLFLSMRPDVRSTNMGRVINDSFILFGEIMILAACTYALTWINRLQQDTLIRRARLAVLFILFSALLNATGQVIWIWYDATLDAVPFPGVNDAFFLSNYPFFYIGIVLLLPRGGSAAGRARLLVDAGAVVLSVLAIFWYLRLGPSLAALGGSALVNTVSLAYPLADLIASLAAVFIFFNPLQASVPQKTLTRLILGIACSATSNMIYSYMLASGTYYSGAFIDAGFPLTWLLISWSMFSYPEDLRQIARREPEQAIQRIRRLSSRVPAIFRAILPLLFALATSALLLGLALQGQAPVQQVLLICAGLFLLPVVRQSLTLIDNMQLNERLRVALDQSQQAFQQSQSQLLSTSIRAEQLDELLANIEHLQEIHARLARGDLDARARVQGPLAPVAQSLNLLIERMNRWGQTVQIDRVLVQESERLCQILDALCEGQLIPNPPSQRSTLSTGNALLIASRLQSRLGTRFQRLREALQIIEQRLLMMRQVLAQVRSNIDTKDHEALDPLKVEQVLLAFDRGLSNHQMLLQELFQQTQIYLPGSASQRTPVPGTWDVIEKR
jgi:hypothetical protein